MLKNKFTISSLCLLLTLFLIWTAIGWATPADPEWFVPYDQLPDHVRLIITEQVSPAALDSLSTGLPPHYKLIRDGMGKETFYGNVYPVYHQFGAIYVFTGSGTIVQSNGEVNQITGPADEIIILETWCTDKLTKLVGHRPPPEPMSTTSSQRVYSGIQTPSSHNTYYGVRATVRFPQSVDTNFNVYTTHVVTSNSPLEWFESAVGQYAWWGGSAGRPNAIFWASWVSTQNVYQMPLTSSSSNKRAEIITRYSTSSNEARMWVIDLDLDRTYYRSVPKSNSSTYRVTLLQEQITGSTTATAWALFRPSSIHFGGPDGTSYTNWTSSSAPANTLINSPMQFLWYSETNREFYARCQ